MALFCSIDDLKRLFRNRTVSGGERMSIGSTSTDHITAADCTAFIEAEAQYIIGMLKRDPGPSPLIRDICASLSAWRIWTHVIIGGQGGDIPEFVDAWKDWAESKLLDIANGKIALDIVAQDGHIGARNSRFRQQLHEKVKLSDTDWTNLSRTNILNDTIKVYDDKDETNEYTNRYDYQVAYKTGQIRRLSTGRITDEQEVYVCFHYIKPGTFREKEISVDADQTSPPRYFDR